MELAYGLRTAAKHGDYFKGVDGSCYHIQQLAEEIIEVPMPQSLEMAAKVGWYLGNQHLAVEVRADKIILEYVHTLAKSLDRIGIPYQVTQGVFLCGMHSSHTH
ncbi:hypothetical protein JIN82_06295 [Persicirhabdus sediminis]|uniref:Urease accessory protein UreE C-terminal domain-containing protein n=1 Tax=Persicirhabdus sediminis TaxID=454144 RepID=A0A8J7MDQ4_9BACT|nr:hypothetical protein [Persicirhabdus sediminis]